MKVFSVYDAKVEKFLQPFFAPTVGAAERAFGEACNDPTHQFYKHPEDFTLFHVAEWDETTGEIATVDVLHALGLAILFKKAPHAAPITNGFSDHRGESHDGSAPTTASEQEVR